MQLVADVVEQVFPVGEEVTVYLVIAVPPSVGAFQEMVAESAPGLAVTVVGAEGVVAGVTGDEGEDAGPAPSPLMATTLKV